MSKRKQKKTTERRLIESLQVVEKPLRRLSEYLEKLTPEERKEFEREVKKGIRHVAKEINKNRRELMIIALAVTKSVKSNES